MPTPILPAAIHTLAHADIARILAYAWRAAYPHVAEMVSDPSGTVVRIGETLVWETPSGRKVLGGLEVLTDSQERIEKAVNSIETANLKMLGALGVAQRISIATLGVTSLTGVLMEYRFRALTKRIEKLATMIDDIDSKVDAANNAHLKSSLTYLKQCDGPHRMDNLRTALEKAVDAVSIYGELALGEVGRGTKVRLPVLNCRGRYYVVALLTELRCRMGMDDSQHALERLEDELPVLKRVAKACFTSTLGADPERYLHSAFQKNGVSLNLLTSIYQQAKRMEIIKQPQIDDASGLFAHLSRERNGKRGFFWTRKTPDAFSDTKDLRYLLACLEETSRLEGLRLMISHLRERGSSLTDLVGQLEEWKDKQVKQQKDGAAPQVFAYAF